ncbi:3beta-hydroxysteroid-dehydrogenase/decarboxylase isoform 1 [Acorus calamus]|uniref:3beta-hydroxysteroid-dehydrogenase/decarboxylase isoform 1 n=1 Tax=Acorus calamus TaxID=4465 RepID=A0AAV9ELS9_ACOCL|nr:3beta-hydroxysteroid-dehydrogenase/decarboxylase isoform 1 [Acorus calamus]
MPGEAADGGLGDALDVATEDFADGDVSKKVDVQKALKGVNCVFHLASYGMSGKEMLQAGRVDAVNLNGTCNILDVCHEYGIKRLVYVSTYNVVFGGKEIINGNESLPYFPIDEHVDPYGRSKSIAEQLVLKSNGRAAKKKDGTRLYTCAIRPAAIYGPGEERHLPRIISLAKMGLCTFKIGKANVKTDWVYIDNLVLAFLLASMGLLDDIPGTEGKPVAAGQSYFISDDDLILLPHVIPISKPLVASSTFILPAEVYKVGVTHYFSFLKAKQELGYIPIVSPREGMSRTILYWKDKRSKDLEGPTIFTWILVVGGMVANFCVAFLPCYGPLAWLKSISLFIFRSVSTVRLVFILAVAAHVGEAVYAWSLSKRVDPANSGGWFWQTFCLGIFSLRFLLKRARRNSS